SRLWERPRHPNMDKPENPRISLSISIRIRLFSFSPIYLNYHDKSIAERVITAKRLNMANMMLYFFSFILFSFLFLVVIFSSRLLFAGFPQVFSVPGLYLSTGRFPPAKGGFRFPNVLSAAFCFAGKTVLCPFFQPRIKQASGIRGLLPRSPSIAMRKG